MQLCCKDTVFNSQRLNKTTDNYPKKRHIYRAICNIASNLLHITPQNCKSMNARLLLLLLLVLFTQHPTLAQPDTLTAKTDTTANMPDAQAINTAPVLPDTIQVSHFTVAALTDSLVISTDKEKSGVAVFTIQGKETPVTFANGVGGVSQSFSHSGELFYLHTTYTAGNATHKAAKLLHVRKLNNNALRQQPVPLWLSILPPLVAIMLALLFRQVILALFTGIFVGAWVAEGMPLTPYALVQSFFRVLDTYIIQALVNTGHLSVILFSMMIGGVVALISRNGGMTGIVNKLAPLAKGPASTQFVAWLLGIAIFFDDYANTLIVGNTIRPITDRFKVSREKLAYIVDSTAAPVAAVAFITTWIGAELGYIGDELPKLTGLVNVPSAYAVFLSSLQYSFYSVFTLIFILIIIFTGRDFGSMLIAERRARTTGQVYKTNADTAAHDALHDLEPVPGAPMRAINGLLPVLIVVLGTLWGLVDTGMKGSYNKLAELGIEAKQHTWSAIWNNLPYLNAGETELKNALDNANPNALWTNAAAPILKNEAAQFTTPQAQANKIAGMNPYQLWQQAPHLVNVPTVGAFRKLGILIGNSDSYLALLWASLAALLCALLMTVSQKIMRIEPAINTMITGFNTMLPALLILLFAWSLAAVTEKLATAEFLTASLGNTISPIAMPVVIFILAALISFSTGSSWSTMAILYPIAIPMTWTFCLNAGMNPEQALPILYNVIAVVLSASVLGDHCSPISDTTILSSLASGCNHIDHVRTQLPYALIVGIVSITCNFLAALGLPFIATFTGGIVALFLIVQVVGKKVSAA